MQVDLSRERSPKTIALAEEAYGPELTKIEHHTFAKLVADGLSATAAYQRVYPNASANTAASQASVLLAHPKMPNLVRGHLIKGRGLVESLVPGAVEELWNQALTGTKDTKPRIDALNSILDRGGLPRAKELSVHVGIEAREALSAFDADVIDVEPLELEEQLTPGELPALEPARAALPARAEGAPRADELDAARAEWVSVVPPESLRTVERISEQEEEEGVSDEEDV